LFLCPSNYPGKGLNGRAHDWIDQIALVCGVPHVPLPVVASISVPQQNVVSGLTTPATLTLNAPAPSTGLAVDLINQPGFFTTPAPLIFSGGQKTVSFVIHANPTASQAFATVSSTIVGVPSSQSAQGHFLILPPSLSGLSLAANYVTSGNATTGRVFMAGRAFSGLTVALTTGDPAVATVPSTVTVAEGDTTATFPVTLVGTSNACTYVRASFGPNAKDAYVAVAPPTTFSRNTKFPIGLSGTVGSPHVIVSFPTTSTSARTVTLSSSNPTIVAIPSTVTVPAHVLSVNVALTIVNSFGASACTTITAHDASGGSNSLILMLDGTLIIAVAG
jgi:trimeric autotransporter adhesin